MTIIQELEQLRSRFPDCMIAAFSDISTGMVLTASHELTLHQEHLDALCATGADILRGEASSAIAQNLALDPAADIVEAVLLNPNEVGIFLCAPDMGADALCCACKPGVELATFLDTTRSAFQRMLGHVSDRKAG
ncbi:MAG: hypothetical protein AAF340_01330 [Pseudomonadota bacterium]